MNEQVNPLSVLDAEPADLQALFRPEGNLDAVLDRIKEQALSEAPDVSTKKGRDAIKSLAYKIARSKTALDNAGKDLTEDARKKIDAVNEERRKIKEALTELAAKVRKPLDDWEAQEDKRKSDINTAIVDITRPMSYLESSEDIKAEIDRVTAIDTETGFDEFEPVAEDAKAAALTDLQKTLVMAEARETQEAELARLRAEAAEREAAEQQRLEEERKAKEEQEAREAEERLAKEKAEREAELERQKLEEDQRKAREAEERRQSFVRTVLTKCNEVHAQLASNGDVDLDELLADLCFFDITPEATGDDFKMLSDARMAATDALEKALDKRRQEKAAAEEAARQAAEEQRLAAESEQRAKDAQHRVAVHEEIAAALAPIDKIDIPLALLEGRIPHVTVTL